MRKRDRSRADVGIGPYKSRKLITCGFLKTESVGAIINRPAAQFSDNRKTDAKTQPGHGHDKSCPYA
jgi:hypothetical protein